MQNKIEIDLPLPPSINDLVKHKQCEQKKIKQEYYNLIEPFLQNINHFQGEVKVKIYFHMPFCCDVDNFFKILIDGLQHHQIIDNDKNIMKLTGVKVKSLRKDQKAIVIIKQ